MIQKKPSFFLRVYFLNFSSESISLVKVLNIIIHVVKNEKNLFVKDFGPVSLNASGKNRDFFFSQLLDAQFSRSETKLQEEPLPEWHQLHFYLFKLNF